MEDFLEAVEGDLQRGGSIFRVRPNPNDLRREGRDLLDLRAGLRLGLCGLFHRRGLLRFQLFELARFLFGLFGFLLRLQLCGFDLLGGGQRIVVEVFHIGLLAREGDCHLQLGFLSDEGEIRLLHGQRLEFDGLRFLFPFLF